MIRFQNRSHARSPLAWDFIKEPSGDDMMPKPAKNQVPLSLLDCLSTLDHQMIFRPIALTKRVRRKTNLSVPLCLINYLMMDSNISFTDLRSSSTESLKDTIQWSTLRRTGPWQDSTHSFSFTDSRCLLVSFFFFYVCYAQARKIKVQTHCWQT